MFYDAAVDLVLDDSPIALESFQHELDDAAVDLVLDDSPTALDSFQHMFYDAAVDLVLDVTVAVDSVDVVEQAYYYLLLILK
jgi:hypothetical protein